MTGQNCGGPSFIASVAWKVIITVCLCAVA
jgi:hypothetical protein